MASNQFEKDYHMQIWHDKEIQPAKQAIRQKGVELLGPSKAALYQIQNKFRWHLILRGQNMQTLQGILADSQELNELKSSSSGKLKLSIDVDPFNLL